MNDNHQKIYNQYRDIMWEAQGAKKCGDRERAIQLCDMLLSCANKMRSPEKENMLTKGFIFRGRLNYMRSDYERAYKDFCDALMHSQHNPAALRYRALTSLVKGPCLKKGLPDHQAMRLGWHDVIDIPGVKNNSAHFAHRFMQIWRNIFRNTGFFPGMTGQNLWRDFSAKFPKLYHTVPPKHEKSFAQKGILVFQTLTDLRAKEDKAEGAIIDKSYMNMNMTVKTFKTESFVFCLSSTPEIAKIRGGILYEIVTERLMQNFLLSVEFRNKENLRFPGAKYFSNHLPYEGKQWGFYISAGAMYYGKSVSYPNVFVKNPHYYKEQEVRIAVDSFAYGLDSISDKFQLLTAKRLSVKAPNPAEWCRKI